MYCMYLVLFYLLMIVQCLDFKSIKLLLLLLLLLLVNTIRFVQSEPLHRKSHDVFIYIKQISPDQKKNQHIC